MKKTKVKMNKPLYLSASILDISKTKYEDKVKLCDTDINSYIIYIKTEDFFEDISNDIEKWFDTSNFDKNHKRTLPIGKNKEVPCLFKDELRGKIIIESVSPRPKTYAYLDDDSNEHKKAKGTKKCVIKQLTFKNFKFV